MLLLTSCVPRNEPMSKKLLRTQYLMVLAISKVMARREAVVMMNDLLKLVVVAVCALACLCVTLF